MTAPRASIIIPVFNQLKFTKGCIESLVADNDRQPYEIIIIDNGSTDGTRGYLESLSRELDHSRDRLLPIFNENNRGVAPAWNQGLKAARGNVIAILNNDIVVTHGWLRGLLWAMQNHGLGLVSPFAANGPLDYDLTERATRFTRVNLGKVWPDYDFCAVALSRRTFDNVGLFDENFVVGGYEDQDYAMRLRKAGIKFGVSGASFIHHFGSQTLGEFKRQGDRHVPQNRDYFIKKWHRDPAAGVGSIQTKLRRTWRNLKMRWDWM